jgi:hypothetical protein
LKVAKRAAQDDPSASGGSENEHYGQEANTSALSDEQRDALRKRRREARELSKKKAKMMELQYWLEFVDIKHRHGSNLRKYHVHWQAQDTQENFFYWLDHGAGKDLELEECSRERLDRMQVRYLSREERMKYLVEVDEQGQLIWAKNGEKVWTKDECRCLGASCIAGRTLMLSWTVYKDSLEGIVPANDPTPAYETNIPPEDARSSSSASESGDDSSHSSDVDSSDEESQHDVADEGENYINEDFHRARGPAKLKYVSAGVLFNHMVRTSLR